MKTKDKNVIRSLLAGIGTILLISHAYAVDYKVYNPAMCHPNNGGEQSKLRHWANGLKNASGDFVWVTCPIVKEDVSGGANILGTSYMWINQWNSQITQCSFRNDAYGQGTVSTATTNCAGPGQCTLNLPATAYNSGTYTIQCRMPPWSRMNNLFYREAQLPED